MIEFMDSCFYDLDKYYLLIYYCRATVLIIINIYSPVTSARSRLEEYN